MAFCDSNGLEILTLPSAVSQFWISLSPATPATPACNFREKCKWPGSPISNGIGRWHLEPTRSFGHQIDSHL